MYLSRIRFNPSGQAQQMLLNMSSLGTYASHQLLWTLFTEQKTRSFLFRQEITTQGPLLGTPEYYVLSSTVPVDHQQLFLIESKPFAPKLAVGQVLNFRLRANPTICIAGKRHDVMMHTKKQLTEKGMTDKQQIADAMEQSAVNWLTDSQRQQEWGIHFDTQPIILSHRREISSKGQNQAKISYTAIDYEGVMVIEDPTRFIQTVQQGVGKSKAFGCGLFLLKRI